MTNFKRQIKTLCAVVLFMGFGACTPQEKSTEDQTRPNILLIVADDLGYTDLGCFGSEIETPNLDILAEKGIRNTAFYTCSTCSPTRAMLLTGVDNHRNGYGTMEGDWADNQLGVRGYEGHLNFDVVTFPKLLQDIGYHTSIAGKWHQAYPSNNEKLWPNKRGFDRSFCLIQGGAGHFSDQQKMFSVFDRTRYTEDDCLVDSLPKDFYSSDAYASKAIAFIDESQELGKPFFSYLAFTAPHWPLQAPDECIDKYKGRYDDGYETLAKERLERAKMLGIVPKHVTIPPHTPNVLPWDSLNDEEKQRSARTMEVYAAMIDRLDWNIGRVIAHLQKIGVDNNTIIIFMADNGAEGNSVLGIADTKTWIEATFDNSLENMGRRNSYIYTGPSWAQVSTLPFKWYKSFSTEGGVRCPSILSYPKWSSKAGSINSAYISVMDIAPTLLDVAGCPHPDTLYQGRSIFPMDGQSLRPWLEGRQPTPHPSNETHCWELYGRRGVLQGQWKALWCEAPYASGQWELYNLEKDPSELQNCAQSHPEILQQLIQSWKTYEKEYQLTLPNSHVAYGIDDVWVDEK